MTDFPRLIEHGFPLKQASLDSVHEKNVRHGHTSTLHIWPARLMRMRNPFSSLRANAKGSMLISPAQVMEAGEV